MEALLRPRYTAADVADLEAFIKASPELSYVAVLRWVRNDRCDPGGAPLHACLNFALPVMGDAGGTPNCLSAACSARRLSQIARAETVWKTT